MNKDEEKTFSSLDINQAILEKKFIALIKEHYNNEIDEDDAETIYEKLMQNFEINNEEELKKVLNEIDPIEDNQDSIVEEIEKKEEFEEQKDEEMGEIVEKEDKLQEEKPKKEKKDKKEKTKDNKKKKKIIIISSIVGGIVLIALIITLVFVFNKENEPKKEKEEKITWKSVLTKEAKDGSLKQKIKDTLEDNNLNVDTVEAIVFDIDSDKDYELVIYTENRSNNKIFTYEIEDEIKYSKDYDLKDKNSLGYVYNKINENCYWYINNDGVKIVISITDKEIEDEEFNTNYYVLPNIYNNQEVLENTVEINLDKENDDLSKEINKSLKNKFTNKEFLEYNNLSINKIEKKIAEEKEAEEQKLAEEQKQKEEEEKKKQEEQKRIEEEKKKKLEEEQKKQAASSFKVGTYNVKFGRYKWTTPDNKAEYYTLNNDYTCSHVDDNGNNISCTFYVGTSMDGQDESSAVERPAIVIKEGVYTTSYFPTSSGFRDTDLENFIYQGK